MGRRKCANCKQRFEPNENSIINGIQFFHNNECRVNYGIANAAKLANKAVENRVKAQKKKDKVRKEQLKTAGDYIKEAQVAVNRYIRARDYGKPCISCGVPHSIGYGGKFDCGHYRSRGSASHLRFNLLNMAGQCVTCNRYNSGNVVEYRKGLINKLGLERVERLEHDNEPRKFSIEYLQRVKKIFCKRARWYEKRLI